MKVNNESLSLTSYQLETKVLNVGLCKYIIALGNINKAYLDCIDNTLLAGNIGNYDCTSLCSSLPGSWRWVWSQWVKTMISIIGPHNVSINHLFFPVRDWCFQIVSDQIQTSFWKIGILCFVLFPLAGYDLSFERMSNEWFWKTFLLFLTAIKA